MTTLKERLKPFGRGTKIYFYILDTFKNRDAYYLCYVLHILEYSRKYKDGWFFYSEKKLQKKWMLSDYSVQTSRKFFVKNGVLTIKKVEKELWMKVNFDILNELTKDTPKRTLV